MKSPFPGMDPFIEARGGLWEDFHDDLVTGLKHAIAALLPDHYVVRSAERSYVELVENAPRFLIEPDVVVAESSDVVRSLPTNSGGSMVAEIEPLTMHALLETEVNEPFLEIYEVYPERRLVTGIEVLSPSNKKKGSPGWKQYTRKRRTMLRGHVNFVEIDLLRGGERPAMADPWPNAPYYLLVSRKSDVPVCKVWPATSLRPLPSLPIPLNSPDADVMLELQPIVDQVYAVSRYHHDIDYRKRFVELDSAEIARLDGKSAKADS